MKASVIVCTYNRSELLDDTLKSLQQLCFPVAEYELIIVDNNSIDNTAEVVNSHAAVSAVTIKYIKELRQGLSYARNTGIAHANGEIIAFTDDDIDATSGWLAGLVSVFCDSNVVAVGGPILPIWLAPKPAWLVESMQGYLSVFDYSYAKVTRILKGPLYPCGVNMAFRKSVFSEMGLFSEKLGRVGSNLLSNEESKLFRDIENHGGIIGFAPEAVIYHKIPLERLTKQWFYHRLYWQGRSDAVLDMAIEDIPYKKIGYKLNDFKTAVSTNVDNSLAARLMHKYYKGYFDEILINQQKNSNRISNSLIKEFCNVCTSYEIAIADQERTRHELEHLIELMRNSYSWRITKPLRDFVSLFRKK